MGAQTPVFGIRYPCSGDVLAEDDLCNFTTDVENALAQVAAQVALMQNRPAAMIANYSASAQNFTVNTATDATFADEVFDNDGMADLGVNNERLTIQTAGVYLVAGFAFDGSGFTTRTSVAIYLTQNGTIRYRDKEVPNSDSNPEVAVTGPMDCAVGDILRLQYRWTGTGGPATNVRTRLSAFMVAR